MDNLFSTIYQLKKDRKYFEAIRLLKKEIKKKDGMNKDRILWCYERLDFFYRKTNQLQEEFDLLETFLKNYHDENMYHHLLSTRYEHLLEELKE